MRELILAENYGDYEFKWQEQYGTVYKVKGCFGVGRALFFSGHSPDIAIFISKTG